MENVIELRGVTKEFDGEVILSNEQDTHEAVSKKNAWYLTHIMEATVTMPTGTGTGAGIAGVKVCGKTGSAEVDTQENTNAWFVGFLDEPAHPYAISVVVEDAGGGGSVAAPIARQVFQWMLNNGY